MLSSPQILLPLSSPASHNASKHLLDQFHLNIPKFNCFSININPLSQFLFISQVKAWLGTLRAIHALFEQLLGASNFNLLRTQSSRNQHIVLSDCCQMCFILLHLISTFGAKYISQSFLGENSGATPLDDMPHAAEGRKVLWV